MYFVQRCKVLLKQTVTAQAFVRATSMLMLYSTFDLNFFQQREIVSRKY